MKLITKKHPAYNLFCEECEKESDILVQVGDNCSRGTDCAQVCADCLQKALDLLKATQ